MKKGVGNIMGGEVMELWSEKMLKRGRREGRAEGVALGEARGIELGEARGRIQAYSSLVDDGVLTAADAARRLGMTEDEFRAKR